MNYLKTILISVLTTIILGLVVYYFVPLWEIDRFIRENLLGATVTEISGSDTMSNFPTVYNANLSSMNSAKAEVSTTTLNNVTSIPNLATIGTITTGTWTSTDIGVAYGGTGASMLGSNLVLLGNGTSAIQSVTAGSNDQILTLVAGVPAWQSGSVDETLNYEWTGQHTGIGIVGEVIAYASSSVPTGWLSCTGQSVSITTYSRLFSLIGYTFGGSGANFNIMDLRGRFITMASSTTGVYTTFAETGGATTTTLTVDEMPAHTHTTNVPTYTVMNSDHGSGANTSAGATASGSTGGGLPHSNVEPYLVLQYIIKY